MAYTRGLKFAAREGQTMGPWRSPKCWRKSLHFHPFFRINNLYIYI